MNRRSARNRHRRLSPPQSHERACVIWHSPDRVERRTNYSLPPLPSATPVQRLAYHDGELLAFTDSGVYALSSGAWVATKATP